jgi:hypothetical protein
MATVVHRFAVGAGPFRHTVRLPASLWPGRYVVRLTGASGGLQLAAASARAMLRPPPEGVVAVAHASGALGGPAAVDLRAPRRQVWARFVFAARPRVGPLTVTWYGPDGRAATPPVEKPNARVVDTFVRAAGGELPRGRWRCALRAGGRLVAAAAVRVG